METEKVETQGHTCPECDKRDQQMQRSEETAFALLLALMPLLTLTLFSNVGLL